MAPISAAGAPAAAESLLGPATEQEVLESLGQRNGVCVCVRVGGGGITQQLLYRDIRKSTSNARKR